MTQAIQTNYPLFALSWVTNALEGYTLFYLFDDALADLLILKTYTHGTSPRSYFSILQTGGQPLCGGQPGRGEHPVVGGISRASEAWNCKGKFHVARAADDDILSCAGCDITDEFYYKFLSPRMYAFVASRNECAADCCDDALIPGAALSTFTPTLKFRYTRDEADEQGFFNDPTPNPSRAAYTTLAITQDHIGLFGTLYHGLSSNLFARISAVPCQFLCGLVKLITVVAIAALFLVPELVPLLTAWLIWETAMCVGRLVVPMLAACICPAGPIPEKV